MKKNERKFVELLIMIEIDLLGFVAIWQYLVTYAENFCR